MFEQLRRSFQEETVAERKARMIPAALSAALIATVYVWTFQVINVYTFPNLPLGVDWPRMLLMWIQLGVALALFGAVAAWFTEDYAGIIGGALIFTVSLAVIFLFSSSASNTTITMQAILMAVILIGVGILAAWGLRWAAHRYIAIRDEQGPDRNKRLAKHVLTLILVGLIPGILMRMDLPAVQALRQLHELLQAAPHDPSVWPRLPLKRVPALQDHFGVDYLIYPRQSSRSAGAMDVTVRFSDGFTMTCLITVGSGESFITQCSEGEGAATSP